MALSKEEVKKRDRARQRRRNYGISDEFYEDMKARQNDCCAICNKTSTENGQALAIDHCHDTGKIRGLLCTTCNLGIGYLNDNVNLLADAIKYLNKEGYEPDNPDRN